MPTLSRLQSSQAGQSLGRAVFDSDAEEIEACAAGVTDSRLTSPSLVPTEPSMPHAAKHGPFSYDELNVLFDDVRALKRSALDFKRQARELEQLQRELQDTKSKLDQLAKTIVRARNTAGRNAVDAEDGMHIVPRAQINFEAMYMDNAEEIFNSVPVSALGCRVLDAHASDLFAQDGVYNFRETIWDAVSFCNLGVLSYVDECLVIIIALLNIIVQSCFIGLVESSMLDSDFADDHIVATMRDWRVLYAHNPDFADIFTNEALAKSICGKSFLRMQGASQADLYNALDQYTRPFLNMPGGGVLCLLSVFLWTLTCAKECKLVLLYLVAIWTSNDVSTPRLCTRPYSSSFVAIWGKPMSWIHGEGNQKNYQIFLTPHRAFTLTLLVGLPRATILIILALVGTLFLVRTDDLPELLLNCVALEVILNVDELVFSILAPSGAARMIQKTLPLRIPRAQTFHKHAVPVISFVLVLIVFVITGAVYLAPLITRMNDTKNVMCSGDRNFLAVQLAYGPVVATPTTTNDMDLIRSSYKYRAIFQRTEIEGIIADEKDWLYLQGRYYAVSGQHKVFEIKAWRDRTIPDFAVLSLGDPLYQHCEDDNYALTQFPSAKKAMMTGVGSVVGNESMQSCQDVTHLCFNDTSTAGQAARFLCPRTCRAGDAPRSGLFLHHPSDGVPKECDFNKALALAWSPCLDPDMHTLLQTPAWRLYVDGWNAYMDLVFVELSRNLVGVVNQTHVDFLRSIVWTGASMHGCSFFAQSIRYPKLDGKDGLIADGCGHGHVPKLAKDRLRTLRPFCPQACKCDTTVKSHHQHLLQNPSDPYNFLVAFETECPLSCMV